MDRDSIGFMITVIGSALVGCALTLQTAGIPLFLLGAGISFIGYRIQKRVISRYRAVRTVHSKKVRAKPRPVLVLFLSYVPESDRETKQAIPNPPKYYDPDAEGGLPGHLEALAREKKQNPGNRWAWEQSLRAINHSLKDDGPLREVILIGTPQSVVQIKTFMQVLLNYEEFKDNRVRVRTFCKREDGNGNLYPSASHAHKNGYDFEEFNHLSKAVDQLIHQLLTEGYQAKDIMIDFTGGMRTAAVVAALATINHTKLTNQYVATNADDEEGLDFPVWGYNLKPEIPDQD